jgi:hypothetical protein
MRPLLYAYSVAIRLSVANFASQAVRLVTTDLLKAHRAAVGLQDKLAALKMAAVGYGLDKAGAGLFGFLEKSVNASKEYTRQLSLMNAAGMTQRDIAQATAAAWATSREVVTSTAADNLKAIRELRSVLGKDRLAEAYAVLPTVQRVKAGLEALTGREQPNIAFEVVKAVDLRTSGLMSQAALARNADLMGRTLMAMGGTLNVNDYLMTLKYAKTAALSFNDQFVYDYLPTLMQEVKGGGGGFMGNVSTAGTALMTLFTNVVQGQVKKAAIPVWEAMGLIKASDVVRNATGSFQIRPGAVAGAQLYAENPLAWAEKVAPAIEKYARQHHLTDIQAITAMGLPRNAAWVLSTLMLKAPQFERDRQLIESTPNTYEAYQRLLKTNPQLADQALHSQWQNLLAIIGFQILPKIIPLMQSFARVLGGIGDWGQKHPRVLDGIVIGLGSLALASMTLGKVLMTAGLIKFFGLGPALASAFGALISPVGLVVGAIALLGIAAYELWKHWDVVGPKLKAAWQAIESAVVSFAGWIGGKLSGMWSGIKSAAGGFFGWLEQKWDWIRNHLPFLPAAGGAANPAAAQSYAVPPTRASTTVQVPVYLDGRKIADVTAKHLANWLNGPQTGVSFFDGRGALAPAGGVGDH